MELKNNIINIILLYGFFYLKGGFFVFKGFKDAARIVFKVGSSTLTYDNGKLNIRKIEALVRVLCDLRNSGKDIILVSSGAVSVGVSKIGKNGRPKALPHKQAMAAIGQCELMYLYDKLFGEYHNTVAQILLTPDVISDPQRKQNAQNTFETLMEYGVIPVVNENDTVATQELEFGDNDTLSAMVAKIVGADALVILSDIDGLFDKNPKDHADAKLIEVVEKITDDIKALAGGAGSQHGTGGMITKLSAAELATGAGIDMAIINGENPQAIYDLIDGKSVGTVFLA